MLEFSVNYCSLMERWEPRIWEFRIGSLPELDSCAIERLESPVLAHWSPRILGSEWWIPALKYSIHK